VLGIIIGIVGILVLNAKTTANFGIITISQAIVSIWFVFLWQQIVFLGSSLALLFGLGIRSRSVILIPAGNCN